MTKFRKILLATFVMNVKHERTGRPDQMRIQVGINADISPEEAKAKIRPLIDGMGIGATFDVTEMFLVEDAKDIPDALRRYVKEDGGGFEILVAAIRSELQA